MCMGVPVADFAATVLAKALVMAFESFVKRTIQAAFMAAYAPSEETLAAFAR